MRRGRPISSVPDSRKPIIPVGPSIAYVPLTQGQYSLIDADMATRVGQFLWCSHWSPVTKSFYAKRQQNKRTIFLHNFICTIAANPKATIDHVNHETLNNCSWNLRSATQSQQQANTRLSARNTSGFKGVIFEKFTNKWKAQIEIGTPSKRNNINLGRFATKELAIEARRLAEEKYFGDFRCLI